MDLHDGERVVFVDTGIEVALAHKSGPRARLVVVAPRSVKIERVAPPNPKHGNMKEQAR